MKKFLISVVIGFGLIGVTYAGGEMKEVCKDKLDKAGKVVNGKDGKPVQQCKTIKVHKKLDGTAVPEKKK